MDLDKILEVIVDSRAAADMATSTLNDLLLFDKIETGMLQMATTECDMWEYAQRWVKPFCLQVVLFVPLTTTAA